MNRQDEKDEATPSEPTPTEEAPAGNHPLEVAARQGFGPLSALAGEAWHGSATPCVTCGQLVPRDARRCHSCGQDLSRQMVEKMRAHAGPWYVLEHLRPFPGVNLERIVKQIRRGLISETSIVRGPATKYQWRFALETPGLCRYFGKCWRCFSQIGQSETTCQQCGSHLTFEPARTGAAAIQAQRNFASPPYTPENPSTGAPTPAAPAPYTQASIAAVSSNELDRLRAAIHDASVPETRMDEPARVGGIRVSWIAVAMVSLVVIALLVVSRQRSKTQPEPTPTRVTAPAPSTDAAPS